MIESRAQKIFQVFNYIIMIFVAFITLYPFWYVLVASLSSNDAVVRGEVFFFPKEFTLFAYKNVLSQDGIWLAYANTVFYVVTGTAVSLTLTVLAAYPLSKKRLKGNSIISLFFVFTMWFSAGIIPVYLNYRDLGLVNTRTAIIIGQAVTTFYIIILSVYVN